MNRSEQLPSTARALALAVALTLTTTAVCRGEERLEPRPLSPAERQAVELAVAYFEKGPAAWWDARAEGSSLDAMGRERASNAIALRAGPAEGAVWTLQTPGPRYGEEIAIFAIEHPSGMDDVLVLELALRGDDWKLAAVSSLVDPVTDAELFPEAAAASVAWPLLLPPPPLPLPLPALAGLTAFVALALFGWAGRHERPRSPAASPLRAAVPAIAALLVGIACGGPAADTAPDEPTAPATGAADGLAPLVPLREALAGVGDGDPVELFGQAPADGHGADIARLWKVGHLVRQHRLEEAENVLDLAEQTGLPLEQLLRARLAFLRTLEDDALYAYDLAARQGIDFDGLRIEKAQAHLLLGYQDEAEAEYRLAAEMGSRDPYVYYSLAELEAIDGSEETAERLIETAWEARPLERAQIFDEPVIAYLFTRNERFDRLELASAEDPAFASRTMFEREPIDLPASADLALLGDHLTVRLTGGRLEIPGGGVLAPPETPVTDAATLARLEERDAIGHLDDLVERGSSAAVLSQPSLRRQTEIAALSLARSSRWKDLIRLTDDVGGDYAHLPPDLLRLRAIGLLREEREKEAMDLLIGLVRSEQAKRRRDPGSMYVLAEILVTQQEFDLALRLIQRANAILPVVSDSRVAQISMQQRLHEARQTTRRGPFRLNYPQGSDVTYVDDLAWILEEELERLGRWIPSDLADGLDVDLFPSQEFLQTYSGEMGVVGLFDGRIKVPFADLGSLHPTLVSILSHELAHAMIDHATDGQAPRWFQEGLAQHIEMTQGPVNPIPSLLDESRVLSLAVVDAALAGFSERQFVDLAYSQASWTLHFVEAEYGIDAVVSLCRAFAAGQTTEEALASVLELSIEELDQRLWAWSRKAPAIWATDLRRYDREADVKKVTAAASTPANLRLVDAEAFQRREAERERRAMAAWHGNYLRRVADLGSELRVVVPMLREGEMTAELNGHCRRLALAAKELMANEEALSPPDQVTGHHLRLAFRRYYQMASACENGVIEDAWRHLGDAEQSIQAAGARLATFGLSP